MTSANLNTVTSPAPGPVSPVKQVFGRPAFLVAVGILLLSALFLNVSVGYLRLHFRKSPVPPRGNLTDLPSVMGKWVQISHDEPVTHDLEETLATNLYVFRDYVNVLTLQRLPAKLKGTRLGETLAPRLAARSPQQMADELAKLEPRERQELLDAIRSQPEYRRYVLSFAVTYYTGKADTVAHVPERCYLADGWNEAEQSDERIAWGNQAASARAITFENAEPGRTVRCNVAYLFQVNGAYTNDSLKVRASLQSLLVKYGYYAKVEVRSDELDRAEALRMVRDFLASAMPEVEKVLPNWADYQGR